MLNYKIIPDEITFRKNTISIICQNMFNYRKKNILGVKQIDFYMKNYPADIYAFQEFPVWGRGKSFLTTFMFSGCECKKDLYEVENIWRDFFPWTEFPSRYWSEVKIVFQGKIVWIINVHISVNYTDQLRLILLKRLEKLRNEYVILLGDFNAAFLYQTENISRENDIFLNHIILMGYSEILEEKEDRENPHYTFAIENKKKKSWKKKKLDHIFVSQNMKKLGWNIKLEYIDEVNLHLNYIDGNKPKNPFTDHSGLKLVIEAERLNSK